MGIERFSAKTGVLDFLCEDGGCGISRTLKVDDLTVYVMGVRGERVPVVRLPACECGAYSFCVAGPGEAKKAKWRRSVARSVARRDGGIEEIVSGDDLDMLVKMFRVGGDEEDDIKVSSEE